MFFPLSLSLVVVLVLSLFSLSLCHANTPTHTRAFVCTQFLCPLVSPNNRVRTLFPRELHAHLVCHSPKLGTYNCVCICVHIRYLRQTHTHRARACHAFMLCVKAQECFALVRPGITISLRFNAIWWPGVNNKLWLVFFLHRREHTGGTPPLATLCWFSPAKSRRCVGVGVLSLRRNVCVSRARCGCQKSL